MLIYVALILFFTFFYVSITFNPTEVADNMKKYGGFIPGIRAGRPTAEYLNYVLTRITVPGAIYLAIVSLIPLVALVLVGANQNFPFGGTSILIIVGVGLETVKQIEAQLQQRHYEGFLRLTQMRLIILGPPGAGKGTQAARLAERLSIPAISTGDIFRANIKDETELGRKVKDILASGGYVPDEVTNEIVEDRLGWDDAEHGLPARRLPPHRRARSRPSTRCSPARGTRSTRSSSSRSTRTPSSSACSSAPRPRAAPTTPRTSSGSARRSTAARPRRSPRTTTTPACSSRSTAWASSTRSPTGSSRPCRRHPSRLSSRHRVRTPQPAPGPHRRAAPPHA